MSQPRVYRPRPRPRPPEPAGVRPHAVAAELNPEQLAAVTHGAGPLLIVAGAGTGKTRTLVHRVAHLLDTGVRPERILLLTFTRRAAHEMLSRAERLVGAASGRVHGGTFHATGHRLLRRFGEAAGLARDFSIMDQGDAEDLMGLSRAQLGFASKERRFPKKETLHWIYSRHINTERPVEEIVRTDLPAFRDFLDDFVRIFADYTERKGERNLVDYDDLLLFWALMLEGSPELADRIAGLYDHVLVDEYQDTNLLQARLLRGMCRAHRNITVVGDDAQSIYSFRGASVRNMLDFPKQFPDARVVALERNYRSTQPILDASNALIARATEGYGKTLRTDRTGGERPWLIAARDEHQQTRIVVDRILELHEEGTPLREIAVLVRAGYMSADLEIELTNRKIPFDKWGGLKFLEAAHVKDVLAFLRVIENPRDEVSWYRLLQLLPGIGDVSARGAIATIAARAWDPDALAAFTPPARARESHTALVGLLRALRAAGRPRATADEDVGGGASADIALVRTMYDAILRDSYDRPEPRLADLDQLQAIAAGFPSRTAFLAALALEPPSATQDLAGATDDEDDLLIISTIHSAKGKEWDAVFLIGAVDGALPMARSIGDPSELEEERRLMYVALTRAREHLSIVFPLASFGSRLGADYSMGQLSRFLDAGVRALMQRVVLAEDDTPITAPEIDQARGSAMNLRAILRGRFSRG